MRSLKLQRPSTPVRNYKKRRSIETRRRAHLFAFFKKASIAVLICIAAMMLYMFAAYLSHMIPAWTRQQLLTITQNMGFVVEKVLIKGRIRTSKADLVQALVIKHGEPILGYDLYTIRSQVKALPWVKSTVIERKLPNTIYVHLIESQPIAIWQTKGRCSLIDQDGFPIPIQVQNTSTTLITVVGKEAPKHTPDLMGILRLFPMIQKRTIAAAFLRCGRWDLHLDSDMTIKLPERNASEALTRFARLESLYPSVTQAVETIDLRLPDSVILCPNKKQGMSVNELIKSARKNNI